MFQNAGASITYPLAGGGSGGGGTGTQTSAANVTAYATGGQANATAMTAFYNDVTVNNDLDSVKMLGATSGTTQKIENLSTINNLAIYPQSGQQFDGYAVDEPYILAPQGIVQFTCFTAGTFK